jgi:hypothetical protein
MAADYRHSKGDSLKFGTNNEVFRIAECQCCSFFKNELQFLVKELKSTVENTNILKEEL